MRIGLLGDIHGNHLALRAVLSCATREKVQRLIITGDLVGYYFWAQEVLELLNSWDCVIVRGNHEQMLSTMRVDPRKINEIEAKYGCGHRLAFESLTATQLNWLENLPISLEINDGSCRILLSHGAPWNIDQYIYPDTQYDLLARCASSDHDFVVLGHTHHPFHRRINATTIVNPGSVGQPRNRKPGAHWVILDTDTRVIQPRVEAYDVTPVIERAQRNEPQLPYLWEVLTRT